MLQNRPIDLSFTKYNSKPYFVIFLWPSQKIFEKNQFTWLKTVHYVQVKLSKIKKKHLEYVNIKPIFNTQCFIPISYLRSHTHNHASQQAPPPKSYCHSILFFKNKNYFFSLQPPTCLFSLFWYIFLFWTKLLIKPTIFHCNETNLHIVLFC